MKKIGFRPLLAVKADFLRFGFGRGPSGSVCSGNINARRATGWHRLPRAAAEDFVFDCPEQMEQSFVFGCEQDGTVEDGANADRDHDDSEKTHVVAYGLSFSNSDNIATVEILVPLSGH